MLLHLNVFLFLFFPVCVPLFAFSPAVWERCENSFATFHRISQKKFTDFLTFCYGVRFQISCVGAKSYFECMNAQNAFRLGSVRSVLFTVQTGAPF